jgi:ABC-2 type transport system permease protein
MFSILKKELNSYFSNPTGYIVIGLFLIFCGLFLWVIPGEYNVFYNGYANVDGLFTMAPWLFLILCPAITMRLFAEEKQNGTWELIISKPIDKWAIIFGKYLSAWILMIVALLPTLLYFIAISFLAEPQGNVDSGAFFSSYVSLNLLAGVFVAIGIFASSLTNNQIISFVLATVISFIMYYGFDLSSSFFNSGNSIQFINNLGMNAHFKSMSRGVIDLRDLAYFIGLIYVFLLFTRLKISKN